MIAQFGKQLFAERHTLIRIIIHDNLQYICRNVSCAGDFCTRSDLTWFGGIGIGGGVMFSALKAVLMIECGIFLLSIFISGVLYANWFPGDAIQSFLFALLVIFFFHAGAIFYMMKMGLKVNEGTAFGEKFTRILLPSFLFILIADVFS